jgi:hypothetical protein
MFWGYGSGSTEAQQLHPAVFPVRTRLFLILVR